MITLFGKHCRWTPESLEPIRLTKDVREKVPEISGFISVLHFENYDGNNLLSESKIFDFIIPITEENAFELHERRIPALMPDLQTIKNFKCKKLFHQYSLENGLDDLIPKTYIKFDELKRDMDGKKTFIVKAFQKYHGVECIIKNVIPESDLENNIVQELLSNNNEYCSHIVSLNGKIRYNVTYRYLFEYKKHVKNYSTPILELDKIVLEQKYLDSIEKFLLPCKYTGVCNADFVIQNDVLKMFEINPRFGGSLMLPQFREDLIDCFECLWTINKEIKQNL
jgi:predicted ATP-grasp superfamily ATP-dependent carboligase